MILPRAARGQSREAHEWVLLAEIGSLSQVSQDPEYFDAIQRISDQLDLQQNLTKSPGMWPLSVNAKDLSFVDDNTFSIGAMSDSAYEYLPKQYMMLGGLEQQYRKMYADSIDVVKKNLLIRPLNQDNLDILMPVNGRVNDGGFDLDPQGQHLVCFAADVIGIGAKIFERDELAIARKLIDGCMWAYEAMPTGIMPETFHMIPCAAGCDWNETEWSEGVLRRQNDPQDAAAEQIAGKRLRPGFTDIGDRRYIHW